MKTDEWLDVPEFSEIADIDRSVASRILRAAHEDNKPWRGTILKVRKVPGRGRGGFRYQVAARSLPENLFQIYQAQRDIATANHAEQIHGALEHCIESHGDQDIVSDAQQPVPPQVTDPDKARLKQKEINLTKFTQLPPKKRQRAEARFRFLNICNEYIRQHGLSLHKGEELFVHECQRGRIEVPHEVRKLVKKLCVRTLRQWIAAEREHGMLGLADEYGKKRGRSKLDDHHQVRDLVIGLIIEKPFIRPKIIFECVRAKYPEAARAITAGPKRANRERTRRQVEDAAIKLIDRFAKDWRQKNIQLYTSITDPDAFSNKFEVAHGSQSEGITALNQRWQLDDTRADLMCTDGRHSAVSVIDIYSRRIKILVVKSVDAIAVGTLFRSAMLAWGAPKEVQVDNGKQYISTHITGALSSLGIRMIRCTPYEHREKGHVERVQGTVQRGLFEILPGYIGNGIVQRRRIEATRSFGERSSDPIETFNVQKTGAELQKDLDDIVEIRYQHAAHSALPVNPATGEKFSPFEIAAAWRGPVRIVDQRALDVLLLMKGEKRWVQKNGINLSSTRYIHPDLGPYIGKQVIAHQDPDDLGMAIVYLAETGEFICVAISDKYKGISLKEMAAKARAIQKRYLKDAREIVKDARREAKQINPADLILQHDREMVAKIAAFPHRQIPHTTPGIEAATEAADALQDAKNHKKKVVRQPVKIFEPDVPVISSQILRIRICRILHRAITPDEFLRLERKYSQGVSEDQVAAIARNLDTLQLVPEPNQPTPIEAGGKE